VLARDRVGSKLLLNVVVGGRATTSRYRSGVKAALYVVGGLAVVAFFIVRQRRSDRFRERSLLFPIALGVYGVVVLNDSTKHHAVSVVSAVLLVLSAVASIGFGVVRGRTIELFERAGELWERASWTTIAVGWGGLLLARVALIAFAAAAGAKIAASASSIPLMLAITLGTQMIVVSQRARAMATPIAPSRRAQRRSRGS
jgi:hypothetical protein